MPSTPIPARHGARADLGVWDCLCRRVREFFVRQNPESAAELCAAFGVSQSAGAAKAKAVRDALAMGQMDPRWYRPSKMEDNASAWMIMVNGLSVDARHLPRDLQEAAYAKGLIPYLPEPRSRHG